MNACRDCGVFARWNIKKNEILPCTTTWMALQGIVLSEISQEDKQHVMSYMRILKKLIDTGDRLVIARGGE